MNKPTELDLIEKCIENHDVAKGIKLAYEFLSVEDQGIMGLKSVIEWMDKKEKN